MSEKYFLKIRKEYLAGLHSLSTKELDVFITEVKLDDKLDIIINPKNKEELEIAKAYLSIFKDEMSFQEIIEQKDNMVKPDENMSIELLINIYNLIKKGKIYNEQELAKKYLISNTRKKTYETLGKIKAHSIFMQGYKDELEEYLNKNIKEKDFDLLLESESEMLKMLDITVLNYKDIKNYANGYHQILTECQNKLTYQE